MARLFVGNLPYTVDDEQLMDFFHELGYGLLNCKVMTDRETGQGRGFAFVEVDDDAAQKVIQDANGQLLGGRSLRVDIATERPVRNEASDVRRDGRKSQRH